MMGPESRDPHAGPTAASLERKLGDFFRRSAPPGVLAAYLFGSHAEGRSHRESDLDIGVLLDRAEYPTRSSRTDARIDLDTHLRSHLGVDRVDLVSLVDAPPELGRRICLDGRLVYCADAEAEHAFRRDVQLRAADLAPWLDRVRRVKLDALAR